MADDEAAGENDDEQPADLPTVKARLSELQERKRQTVRWHMSRNTAERAIAAITGAPARLSSGRGKPRRRKRHKRLL
jgi:hypothetical protein